MKKQKVVGKNKNNKEEIKERNILGIALMIIKTFTTIKKNGMKKDTLRTILTLVATLVATFFAVSPEVLNQGIDLALIIISSVISLYNVIMSIIKPADDIVPAEVQRELDSLRRVA